MSAITAKSLKPVMFAAYTALAAENLAQAHTIRALRDDLAMAQSAPVLPHGKAVHTSYYDYVRACRVEAKRRGQRVCTYKSFAQWNAARDVDTRSPAVRDMDALLNSVADEQCAQARDYYNDSEPALV